MKTTTSDALRTSTVEHYLEALASSDPAPGGGAVVALLGAQAAALLAMALRITNAAAGSEELTATLDTARASFLSLAEADAAAFAGVLAAYRMPQQDDEAKAERKAAVQEALKGATRVPLQVIEQVAALYRYTEGVTTVVKATVASDVGVALQLAHAALKASRYNVWVNLKYIEDSAFKKEVRVTVASFLKGKKQRRLAIHRQIKDLVC